MDPSRCPNCSSAATRHVYCKTIAGKEWNLARCNDCGQHFTDPSPTPQDISGFYSSDYHANLCQPGATERAYGAKFRRYVDWIRQFVPPGRTLDVGCTTGLLPRMLQDAGYQASGIDLNAAAAEWGRTHYNVPISSEHLEDVAARGETFDLLTLTDVLEHTPKPPEFLAMVRGLLNSRGYLMVTFPDISSLESKYYRLFSKIFRRPWLWMTCQIPHHIWEFTPATARALFTKERFEVVGFQRAPFPFGYDGKLWPASIPVYLMRPLANQTGTQMEFMLRRVD